MDNFFKEFKMNFPYLKWGDRKQSHLKMILIKIFVNKLLFIALCDETVNKISKKSCHL